MLRFYCCALTTCTSLVVAGQSDPVPLRIAIDWVAEQPIAFTHTQIQTTNKPESLPVTVPVSTRLPDGNTADGVWITPESPIGMRGIEIPLSVLVEPDGSWEIETSFVSAVDAPLRITRPIRVAEGELPVRFRDPGDPASRLDHPSLVPGPASAVSNPPIASGFNYDSTGEPAGLDFDEFNEAMSRAIAAVNAMLVADQTFSLTLSIIWDTPSPTESFLMYALPVRNDRRWSNVKTAFNALYTSNDSDPAETLILDNLPPGSLVDYSSKAFTNNATDDICLSDPLLQKYFNAGGAQAVIAIDPTAPWDYDAIDGVDAERYDFVNSMVHEIGHHLGFMCELEAHEANQLYNFVSNWDVFRFNNTVSGEGPVISVSEFRTASRELRFGVASGAMTWVQNSAHFYELCTGKDESNPFSPTSGQSSHWAVYDPTNPLYIGTMSARASLGVNPSTQYGFYLTPADVEAFDVMGYDIDQNALAIPATEAILNTPLASADLDPRFAIDFEWDKGSSVSSSALIIRDATMNPGDPNSLVYIQRDLTAESFSLPAETLEPLTDYTWEVTSVRTGGVQLSERRAFATNCPADTNGDGVLDNGDICAFVDAFLVQDPIADWNLDGVVDNGDIDGFVAAFLAGC